MELRPRKVFKIFAPGSSLRRRVAYSLAIVRLVLAPVIFLVRFLKAGLAAWKANGYPVEPYREVFHLYTPNAAPRSGFSSIGRAATRTRPGSITLPLRGQAFLAFPIAGNTGGPRPPSPRQGHTPKELNPFGDRVDQFDLLVVVFVEEQMELIKSSTGNLPVGFFVHIAKCHRVGK